jgi:hypothetical protein
MVGKEQHVQKVPQWYEKPLDSGTERRWSSGQRIFRLDADAFMFEFSDKMETVETFKPAYDAHRQICRAGTRAVFYDPDAFVAPCVPPIACAPCTVDRSQSPVHVYRVLSNIQNTDGRPKQLTNADPRYVDYYGRPGPKNWKRILKRTG